MKFHPPSFLLGVGVATVVITSRERLRPVVVEVTALAVHLARLGRGLLAREREEVEDLWAEVEERVRTRIKKPASSRPEKSHLVNGHARAQV